VPAIISLAALVTLALWQPWKKSPAPLPLAAHPPPDLASAAGLAKADAKSVAVLAFANMSADKDTEYFSDGISEEILNALANNPALRVAGRTSSFSFKGKNATHVEIGRALNVARVIEGSVRKAGNRVRITVQLINAADGIQLWSEKFDKEMTDIFAVQSEIATTVAQKLAGGSAAPAANVTVAAGAETKDLAAYDAYLRGRAAQTKGNSPAVLHEAMHHYEEALRLDPGYAMAWARLAQVYVTIWSLFDGTDELAHKARTAVATAARLEPSLPEAHLALAAFQQWIDRDFDAAQRELDQVERQRPHDAEVPAARALLEFERGNWGERLVALAALAAERDPQNADSLSAMGTILTAIGKFAEADRLFDGARSGQTFPGPFRMKALLRLTWTGEVAAALALLETCPERLRNENFYLTLAEVIALRGDAAATFAAYDQARTALRREQPSFGRRDMETVATYRMGWYQARLGNPARAEELYTGALALAEKLAGEFPRESSPRFNIALIQARRGQKTTALAAAEEAMRLATRTQDARQRVFPRQMPAVVLASFRETGRPGQEYLGPVRNADVLASLGETDAAIAELRALHEKGWAFGYRLRVGLEWEPLRGEAKFQQLMKEAEARADAVPRPKR
jgi:TolB-like protein/tetratricopeptide (TPR) repeat protein